MSIEEFYNLSNAEKVEVAKKIAQTTIMSYAEVKERLSAALTVYGIYKENPADMLPTVPMAQILVELDRIKE